jgi:hypothetical protein
MDNVQRIYHRSERQLIPRRPCPDCGRSIQGNWKEHPGMTADVDPTGSVSWRCLGETCFTGKESF